MSRFFSRINPTLRGLLILAAIAGLIVVFQLEQTLVALNTIARIAFLLAIAYFIFLVWRERREGISMWSQRARVVFYGAAIVAVADVGVYWYGGAVGYQILAFIAVLALCGLAMFRTWRDQHTVRLARACGEQTLRIRVATDAVRPRAGDSPTMAYVDLYWLPLGAGGHFVRINGRVYEWFEARVERREPLDLYHSGLEVDVPEGRYVIEMAPVPAGDPSARGAVAEGAVWARWLRPFGVFRYEVRRWRDGAIPDVAEAVESPRRLTDDLEIAQRLLELVPSVPTLVWGRDELHVHDMWNSNSLVAWLLACSGIDAEAVRPPAGGRAPGWHAGLVAARQASTRAELPSRAASASRTGTNRPTKIGVSRSV